MLNTERARPGAGADDPAHLVRGENIMANYKRIRHGDREWAVSVKNETSEEMVRLAERLGELVDCGCCQPAFRPSDAGGQELNYNPDEGRFVWA